MATTRRLTTDGHALARWAPAVGASALALLGLLPLDQTPRADRLFKTKAEGCVRVVLRP